MSRHLGLVFRGTGGVIGEDYVSRTVQGASRLVEEINPHWPATMGGLPVGVAGGIGDPSMQHGIDTAVEDAKHIIARNPDRKIVVGGYSAGAVAAAKVRKYVLETMPERYVCGFTYGDPSRPAGGSYFGGVPVSGHGISTWRYGDVKDFRQCWIANKGDMYTSVPNGDTGLIMGDFYDIITKVQLSDPMGTFGAILESIPAILQHTGILPEGPEHINTGALDLSSLIDGISGMLGGGKNPKAPAKPLDLGDWLNGLLGAGTGSTKPGGDIFAQLGAANPLGMIINSLTGLLDGNPDGLAAAINAAVVGIKFAAAGTAPHITYEFAEAWPGQSFLGLGIQHLNYWASTVK